jgi:hypothetical protein
MVGFLGSIVGGAVIVVLILVGVWLTWISLRSDRHQPQALQRMEPDDTE